ncbi:alpha/beta fold hydrolase [Streptomyces sp. NPDC088789]|uniref:alpha/beta fold hydrolase n=1 Tax=Streptomyces sp. NPDC088789 TaxID=3365899 RepID=UPI00380848A9
MPDTHHGFTRLPAGRFHYQHWAGPDTDRPPALLLHGGTASTETWRHIAPALARTRTVYALDLRGHGLSTKPARGMYHLWRAADDVTDLITDLGLERPLLVGHSWGAAIALVLATGRRTRGPVPHLSALVLEEPPPTMASPVMAAFAEAAAELAGGPEDRLRHIIRTAGPRRSEGYVHTLTHGLHHTTPTAVRGLIADGADQGDLLPLLAAVPVPVLLLRSDPAVRSELDTAAWRQARHHLRPDGRMTQIADADHDIHRTHPEQFLAAVEEFTRTTDGTPRTPARSRLTA